MLARDESQSHIDPDFHRRSSRYVFQCDKHKEAGSSAVEAHGHNISKQELLRELEKHVEDVAQTGVTLDFKNGLIRFNHPQVTPAIRKAVARWLDDHPVANMKLVD